MKNKKEETVGIIYLYTSPSQKYYVGQTIKESRRKAEHRYNKNKSRKNTKMSNAINKYGFDNFEYRVLFRISESDCTSIQELRLVLNRMERMYIKKYDSVNSGYNCLPGATFTKDLS